MKNNNTQDLMVSEECLSVVEENLAKAQDIAKKLGLNHKKVSVISYIMEWLITTEQALRMPQQNTGCCQSNESKIMIKDDLKEFPIVKDNQV